MTKASLRKRRASARKRAKRLRTDPDYRRREAVYARERQRLAKTTIEESLGMLIRAGLMMCTGCRETAYLIHHEPPITGPGWKGERQPMCRSCHGRRHAEIRAGKATPWTLGGPARSAA